MPVLEVAPAGLVLVRCLADPDALDRLPQADGRLQARIASDELLVLVDAAAGDATLEELREELSRTDPAALVLDHTDAWTAVTLHGATREAFARLSENPLPVPHGEAMLVQGAIAAVPGKAVVMSDRIHLLVPSTLGHHLLARIRSACADLGAEIREGTSTR